MLRSPKHSAVASAIFLLLLAALLHHYVPNTVSILPTPENPLTVREVTINADIVSNVDSVSNVDIISNGSVLLSDPERITADAWNQYLVKGSSLMCAFDAQPGAANYPVQSEFASYDPTVLAANGWSVSQAPAYLNDDFLDLPDLLAAMGMSTNTHDYQQIGSVNAIDLPGVPRTLAHTLSDLSVSEGLFIAYDILSPSAMVQNRDNKAIPPLHRGSDVAFLQWLKVANGKSTNPADLKYIMMRSVVNRQTLNVVFAALSRTGNQLDDYPGSTFATNTDEGKALLGTPNGYGPCYFLLQHKAVLGNKRIDSVSVFEYDGDIMLRFNIVDSPSASVSRRDIDIKKRDTPPLPQKISAYDWRGYVVKGSSILCAFNAAPDDYNYPVASQWTDPGQVEAAGWQTSRPAINDVLRDSGAAPMLQSMDFSSSEEDNTFVQSVNSISIPGVLHTNAYYMSSINAEVGLLIAANNQSPKTALYEWGREGAPTPPLKQWSDVAFLQWKQQATNEGVAVQNLKYILRYNVQNDETTEVIMECLNHGTPGLWPGIEFDINSEEGRALLGTPNGYGVGYLLLQHRADLGRKMIRSVNIFSSSARAPYSWLMLRFNIVDAPASS